ncbi:hypothetical protein [Mesorhizobium sp.]|uniref:hypothetical protein n=1 Tax=Mesorhizobium sp. TaxID=1871066 RepID=UPI000FE32288|nr:hypothetical protein [Mesorhizobium sp.]RWJ03492.1 MAG: hypothetical protein EOR24_32445 [Mesorhizobium sp.]
MKVKVREASQFTEHDISVEFERVYFYANGEEMRIAFPKKLFVKTDERGDSHRVVAKDGFTYYPRRGWVGIAWRQVDGSPLAF